MGWPPTISSECTGQGRPFTFSNRPGFSVNGPVRLPFATTATDKTFFWSGLEAIRDSRPRFDAGSSVFVPTAAMKAGISQPSA